MKATDRKKNLQTMIISIVAVLLLFSLVYYIPAVKDYIVTAQSGKAAEQAVPEQKNVSLDITYNDQNIYATVFPEMGYAKVFTLVDEWNAVEMKELLTSTFIMETKAAVEKEFGSEEAGRITIIGVDNHDASLSGDTDLNFFTCFVASPDAEKSSDDEIVYNVNIFENGSVIWSGSDSELFFEVNDGI